ncbi:NUDIX hydrolase domain-like protein [Lyophyllum atratum]|nr:NUDIX hydrolase domain-like protein [Lyophyllum atratum]
MAAPRYPSTQYLPGEFVISAGSILFRKTQVDGGLQICLVHSMDRDEWLLPKGRKDRGESLAAAAVRETFEETGYPCALWPQRMPTRAPLPGVNDYADVAAIGDDLIEPVAVTVRDLGEKGAKIIWWYITLVTGEERVEGTLAEYEVFESHFLEPGAAIERLTFQKDRELVRKVWDIVSGGLMV